MLQGKVEAEIELLTKEGAEEAPAGKRREEPQPLEKPKYDISNFGDLSKFYCFWMSFLI